MARTCHGLVFSSRIASRWEGIAGRLEAAASRAPELSKQRRECNRMKSPMPQSSVRSRRTGAQDGHVKGQLGELCMGSR